MVVDQIWVYPFKSLAGVSLTEVGINKSGALANDRRWAFFLKNGKTLNAKRSVVFQTQKHSIDLEHNRICFGDKIFGFDDAISIEKYVSALMGQEVLLKENGSTGFPDDTDLAGPTVVLKETLECISQAMEIAYAEVLKRFRPNIIISGEKAFAEDHWLGKTIEINGTQFVISGLCNRCIVPTRNSTTGIVDSDFKNRFVNVRQANSSWRIKDTNDHYYKLCLNTQMLNYSASTIKTQSIVKLL